VEQDLLTLPENLNSPPVFSKVYNKEIQANKCTTQLEQFEDSKWVMRIRKSTMDRHHNGQQKKDKRGNKRIHNLDGQSYGLRSYPF
jgi:hypothetical protein